MRTTSTLSLIALLPLAAGVHAQCIQFEDEVLTPSDRPTNGLFGATVAIQGEVAVVGALRGLNDQGLQSGAVYVYEKQGDNWIETSKLLSQPNGEFDRFGASVTIDGEWLVVDARLHEDPDLGNMLCDSGAVFVFQDQAGVWTQTARLEPAGNPCFSQFGGSVAVSGSRILARSRVTFTESRLHVFDYDGSDWMESAVLGIPGSSGSIVAEDLDLDGDRMVVGRTGSQEPGAAYVYEHDGTDWSVFSLTSSDGDPSPSFGHRVALSGDRLLVSANWAGPNSQGKVYVFQRTPSGWEAEAVLEGEPSSGNSAEFGSSVDLDGNLAVISEGLGGGADGAVQTYVYHRASDGWRSASRLQPNHPLQHERFGTAIALEGGTLLAGSFLGFLEGTIFEATGTATVYQAALGQTYCSSTPNSSGSAASIVSLGCSSISVGDARLVAESLPSFSNGLFYFGQQEGAVPFGNGLRCVTAGPLGLFRFPPIAADSEGLLEQPIDFNQAPADIVAPGSTWNFQAWFRDPAGGGAAFDLSDAVRITFRP